MWDMLLMRPMLVMLLALVKLVVLDTLLMLVMLVMLVYLVMLGILVTSGMLVKPPPSMGLVTSCTSWYLVLGILHSVSGTWPHHRAPSTWLFVVVVNFH